MSDMTASAASQMESMSTRAATTGAKHGLRATVTLSGGSARVSAHVAHRTAGGTIRALVAIIEAARFAGSKKGDQGRVGLKQFTKITNGKREILPVNEKAVATLFARELRKHGVTFAIEKHKDGSRTFHVEGKDAAVVEHALAQASARVDERIQRAADRSARRDQGEPERVEQETSAQTQGDDPAEGIAAEGIEHAAEPDDLTVAEAGARDLSETDELPAPEIILQLDRREQAALAQALHGAPHREALGERIQSEAQVVLNRENVAVLDTVIAEQGWTPESSDMGWVAGAVAQEHDRIAPPTVDNPWLTVDPERTQDAPVVTSNPFAPGEWEGHKPQDEAQTPSPTVEPPAAGEPEATARAASDRQEPEPAITPDRQLSPRDATRERVAKQIDTKATSIKQERGVGQTKNRATPRSPKVKR